MFLCLYHLAPHVCVSSFIYNVVLYTIHAVLKQLYRPYSRISWAII